MIFNAQENSIKWNEIDIWLDFNNLDENNCEIKIRLNYINSTPAIKFLGVYIDPLLTLKAAGYKILCQPQARVGVFYTPSKISAIFKLESLKFL